MSRPEPHVVVHVGRRSEGLFPLTNWGPHSVTIDARCENLADRFLFVEELLDFGDDAITNHMCNVVECSQVTKVVEKTKEDMDEDEDECCLQ